MFMLQSIFCPLPKRNWAKYFDDKVVMAKNDVGAQVDSNKEDSDNNESTEEDNDESAEEDSEEVEESEVEEFLDDDYFSIASDQEELMREKKYESSGDGT